MEKSDIETLREFAKSTNRSIIAKEIPYPRTGIGATQKYKRMVYVPNNREKTSFFIWFSDPYTRIGLSTIFSGAFIPLSSRIKTRIKIRNRNIPVKLNIFSKTKSNKIGNSRFASKVVISGDIDAPVKRLLSQTKIQEQLLKALEIKTIMNISLNEYKIDFVPEFIDVPYLAIIDPQGWTLETGDIEKIFRQIEKIRNVIH